MVKTRTAPPDAPLLWTVTGSDIVSGEVVELASGLVTVAENDAAVGEVAVLNYSGRFTVPKASADVVAVGARLYWTGAAMTLTATANVFAGVAAIAAGNGVTSIEIQLNAGGAPDGA